MPNDDNNSQKGLGSDNMDPQTKHDIQSKGGQASHGGGGNQGQGSSSQQGGQGGQNQSGSESRGFGAMKEQGRDEEVSEIASLGGQSSHGGGRQSQGQEE